MFYRSLYDQQLNQRCPKGHFKCALGIEVAQNKAFPVL